MECHEALVSDGTTSFLRPIRAAHGATGAHGLHPTRPDGGGQPARGIFRPPASTDAVMMIDQGGGKP